MARGMHKPKNLVKRQSAYEGINQQAVKTVHHRPGSNKK